MSKRGFPTECQLCGELGVIRFRQHVKIKHHLTPQEYYDMFFKKEEDGVCVTCGASVPFGKDRFRYYKWCDERCQTIAHNSTEKEKERKSKLFSEMNTLRNNALEYEDWRKERKEKIIEGSKKQWTPEKRARAQDWGRFLFRSRGKIFSYGSYKMSKMEMEFAQTLDTLNISWEYEPFTFTPPGFLGWTTPDFLLPEIDVIIELRPFNRIDEKLRIKMEAYKDDYTLALLIHENNWDICIELITSLYAEYISRFLE